MKNKMLMAGFIVMISFLSLGADAAQKARDIEEAREKIALLQQRAYRDLAKANDLREKSQIQIHNAQAIMERASQNPEDTEINPMALEIAPQALERGKTFLAEAEALIKQARLRLEWSERAMKNLEPGKSTPITAGMGLPITSEGHWGVRPQGESDVRKWPYHFDYLVQGDYIRTEKDGRVKLFTHYSPDFTIMIGPESSATLLQDNVKGTRWMVHQGKIHFKPEPGLPGKQIGNIPLIETPRRIVEAEPGSEFDVIVDEKVETHVKVYKGNVKIKDSTTFMDIAYDSELGEKEKAKNWWE